MAAINKPSDINKIWANGGDKVSPSDVKIGLGWEVEVPPRQYFNWLDGKQDQAIAHINQHGISVWDAVTEYQANKSYVQGSDGKVYVAVQTHTNQNPVSELSYWRPLGTGLVSITMTSSDVTLTATQAANPVIVITGALAANVNLVFPTYAKHWTVINNTTGAFTVVCKTAAGSGVPVSGVASIAGDGVNIVSPDNNLYYPGLIGSSVDAASYLANPTQISTFTASSIIVGESLSGRVYRLANISELVNTGVTGANGMDSGLAPVSGYVAVYIIYNPSTGDVSAVATDCTSAIATPTYTKANMPAGYTASGLIAVIPTNASRQFVRHVMRGKRVSVEGRPVLTNSSTQRPSATSLDISSGIPINAISAKIALNIGSSAAASGFAVNIGSDLSMIGANGTGTTITSGSVNPALTVTADVQIVKSTPQTIYYTAIVSSGTMALNMTVSGYEF